MNTLIDGDVYQFDLSLQKPLSLNDRDNRFARNAKVQQVRDEVAMMVRVVGVPRREWRKVKVTLLFRPPDKRRRDADNLVATLKAVCDGLVDADVVADDTPAEMVKEMPVIGEVLRAEKGKPVRRFWVRVERLV